MTKKVMVFIVSEPTVAIGVASFECLLIFAIIHCEFLKGGDTILIGIDFLETNVAGAVRCSAYTGPY